MVLEKVKFNKLEGLYLSNNKIKKSKFNFILKNLKYNIII